MSSFKFKKYNSWKGASSGSLTKNNIENDSQVNIEIQSENEPN
jgi:hypothetical protein